MAEQRPIAKEVFADAGALQRQVNDLLDRVDTEQEDAAEAPGAAKQDVEASAVEEPEGGLEAQVAVLDRQLAELSKDLLEEEAEHVVQAGVPAPAIDNTERGGRSEAGEPARGAAATTEDARDTLLHEEAPAPRRSTGMLDALLGRVASGLEPVAGRVSGLPRSVRDSIGWIAVVTFFYAVCVWAVVLFMRGAAPEAEFSVPLAGAVEPGAAVGED